MRRVMVIGGPGSGKTTFGYALGRRTGLPVTSLDTLYWLPGWTQRPAHEAECLALRAAAGESWIIDGNYTATFAARLRRADTVVFLDIGTGRRLVRVVTRTLKHFGAVRPHMAEGCPERFSWDFLLWVARYRWRGRVHAVAALADRPAGVQVVRLGSSRAVSRFLAGCDGAMPGGNEPSVETEPDLR